MVLINVKLLVLVNFVILLFSIDLFSLDLLPVLYSLNVAYIA
jgi:hypothetical protein